MFPSESLMLFYLNGQINAYPEPPRKNQPKKTKPSIEFIFNQISSLENKRRIILANNSINNLRLKSLLNLISTLTLPKETYLDLSSNDITDSDIKYLINFLKKQSHIKFEINIKKNKISNLGFNIFYGALKKIRNIIDIKLSYNADFLIEYKIKHLVKRNQDIYVEEKNLCFYLLIEIISNKWKVPKEIKLIICDYFIASNMDDVKRYTKKEIVESAAKMTPLFAEQNKKIKLLNLFLNNTRRKSTVKIHSG